MTNKICDGCETVAHCLKKGCVPKTTKKDEALKQAQRKPKTEEFIKHAWANSVPNIGFGDFLVLFRAIEASHNIKEKNT